MYRSKIVIIISLLFAALLLSACQPAQPAQPEAAILPPAEVLAQGRVEPIETQEAAFAIPGQVVEVLVKEGDPVKAGDVLARLGDRTPKEASVANAELELLNAQQALDKLADQAATASVEALRRIVEATREVRDARYQLDNYTPPASLAGLDPFDAVDVMKKNLDNAQAAYEPFKSLPESDSNREEKKDELDQAQSDYNAAVRQLEYVIALQTAQADLEQAIKDYDAFKTGPKASDIEAAQSRISAAEANLAAAKAALQSLELRAPAAGMVVGLNLKIGQIVTAGQPVMTIVDFSTWVIKTDDLTELEVVKIAVGQKVSITLDALPDQPINGAVTKIDTRYEEKRGDITYTVTISLDNPADAIRWGMTGQVTFSQD